MIFQIYAIFSN